jgi:hypothetical protein
VPRWVKPRPQSSLLAKLQRWGVAGSMGVDRGNSRCVRGARLRVVICVSLSTAATALPPSTPMSLNPRLQGMGAVREQARVNGH